MIGGRLRFGANRWLRASREFQAAERGRFRRLQIGFIRGAGFVVVWACLTHGSAALAQTESSPGNLRRSQAAEPAAARETFFLDSDLRLELIAAEPLIADPVAIDFDAQGRAFVVEMRGYSEQSDARLGRVRRIQDVDGDDRWETSTDFASGFRAPTGIVCLYGGCLVADAPDLIWLGDSNQDGIADDRLVVVTGFGTANIQQLVNNLQWGLDGKLYGASGGNGGKLRRCVRAWPWDPARQLPEPVVLDLPDRDFCIDFSRGTIQAISGGGQFGWTWDAAATRYVCSNADHCQQIVLEDYYLARNPELRSGTTRVNIACEGPAAEIFRRSPVEPWRALRTELRIQGLVPGPIEGGGRAAGYFSGACGLTCYDGDALPAHYAGSLFVADAGSNLVHQKVLETGGWIRTARRAQPDREFLASTDNWFRPVQLVNAPDGGLWILDMYREVIEHPASLPESIKRQLELNSGNDRGRIYRVMAADRRRDRSNKLVVSATDSRQWVRLLTHSNGWHRRLAARLLYEHGIEEVQPELRQVALNASGLDSRLRAAYLLHHFGDLTGSDLQSLLNDRVPEIRCHALRLCESYPDAFSLLLTRVDDSDSRVRFQLALTLGQFEDRQVPVALAKLAQVDLDSAWYRTALASSASVCRIPLLRQLIEQTQGQQVQPGMRSLIRELVYQAGLKFSSQKSMAGGFAAAADSEVREQSLELLAQLISDAHSQPSVYLGDLFLGLQKIPVEMHAGLAARFAGLTGEALSRVQSSLVERSIRTAVDDQQTSSQRVAAIEVLALAPAERYLSLLPDLLNLDQPLEIQQATLVAAAAFGDVSIAESIAERLTRFSPELRQHALLMLLSRESWTRELLEAVAKSEIPVAILDASSRQQLLRHPSIEIQRRAAELLAAPDQAARQVRVREALSQVPELQGDSQAGRSLFRKHCAGCHRLEETGQDVGPGLIGYAYRSELDLLTHVLDPNREVDPRYLSYTVQLRDGRQLLGAIASEAANSLTLRLADGNRIELNREEIDEIRSTTLSLMPENIADDFSPQMLADLTAYFASLRN